MLKFNKLIMTVALVMAMVSLSSCDSNDEPKFTDVQPGFRFETADTLVSSISHNFDVKVTQLQGNSSSLKDWEFFSVSVWNDALASNDNDGWEIVSMGLTGKEIDLGWIKLSKIPGVELPEMKCEIKANTTSQDRKVRIIIGERNGSIIRSGEIILSQKGKE